MATKRISIEDFRNDPELSAHLSRGREVARALDAKTQELPHAMIFTSLEFVAFVSEMTPKRVELLRAAVRKSRSISELALAVHREQSAVSKDVARLARLGLVKVQEVSNAGHGLKKIVVPVAESISINANFALP